MNPAGSLFVRQFESAASPLEVKPIIAHVHGLADIEHAAAEAAAQPDGGMFVPLDVTLNAFMEQTVATIARHRLPAIYSERAFVTSGGLVYYGTDRMEQYRGAASYVNRILRGEKAGDLPFQLPTKYELVINLKTALVSNRRPRHHNQTPVSADRIINMPMPTMMRNAKKGGATGGRSRGGTLLSPVLSSLPRSRRPKD
jgi:hypothetical protein